MVAPVRIPLALVYPSDHGRPVVQAQVALLAESLSAIGLQTPISVRACTRVADGRDIDAYEIVTGRHRYEAARTLGWREVEAFVLECDADTAELWEIDENFVRAELTDAQRADHHVRRERILIAKGVVKDAPKGGRPRNSDNLSAYSAQAAETLGVDERTVRRDLRRGKNIAPEVLAEVTGTDMDKGVVLDALAATPREEQHQKLQQMREARRTEVKLAADPLNDLEATEKQLAALMSAWNRAGAGARQKFLDRIDAPVFDRSGFHG